MTQSVSIGWYGPTDGYWGWILEHFRDVVVLREKDLPNWVQGQLATDDADQTKSSLIFASDFRNDTLIDRIRVLDSSGVNPATLANLPWCLMLGTDWSGHRRTKPLPDAWHIFYWYELFDRLLPWLTRQCAPNTSISQQASCQPSSPNARKLNPRVGRWLEAASAQSNHAANGVSRPIMALVITDRSDARQLWSDIMNRNGIQSIYVSPDQTNFWAEPDFILFDLASPPFQKSGHAHDQNSPETVLENSLRKLSLQFPKVMKIVVDPFPRWQTWETLQSIGADLLVGQPHDTQGLLETIRGLVDT